MPVRVELVMDASADLEGLAPSGNLKRFLAKLVRLEDVGKDAGQPLGDKLTGLRKIVVGDRNWRIIFKMNAEDTVATIWMIGDRNDATCYLETMRRLRELGNSRPEVMSFAAAILTVMERRLADRKKKRKGR